MNDNRRRSHHAVDIEGCLKVHSLLQELSISPVTFFTWYITDSAAAHSEVIAAQKPKLFASTWNKTKELVEDLLSCVQPIDLEELIVEQASSIVLKQAKNTRSDYISTSDFTSADLSSASFQKRRDHNKQSYSFLYTLLKLLLGIDKLQEQDEEIESSSGEEEDEQVLGDDGFEEVGEGRKKVYLSKKEKKVTRRRTKLENVLDSVISTLQYTINRRHNGRQMMIGLALTATGVSERIHEYLNDTGIAVSRRTISNLTANLTEKNVESTRYRIKSNGETFTITFDNVDGVDKVVQVQINLHTTQHHHTFGFIHFMKRRITLNNNGPPPFLTKLTTDIFNPISLATHRSTLPPVSPAMLMPSPAADAAFRSSISALLYIALQKNVPHLKLKKYDPRSIPPVIEQLSHEIPDIAILKLMKESDNSIEGVGTVLQALCKQLGLTEDEFASKIMVLECDGGSAALLEGLRRQRAPDDNAFNGLHNVMGLIGGTHLEWVIGSAILRRYYGSITDSKDCMTISAMMALLGRKGFNIDDIKDYNKLGYLLRYLGEVLLLNCFLQVCGVEKLSDLNQTHIDDGQLEIHATTLFSRFLSSKAISTAKRNKESSPAFYESLIQLRDVLDFQSGILAKKQGDIGRVVLFWSRSNLLLYGIQGVRQYRTHLPHLLLDLNYDLPPDLVQVLRRTMLISPSGRPGHCVYKDYYLETLNWWLKFFFGYKNAGIDWLRLENEISSNILVFRDVMKSLKILTGRDIIYRNHSSSMNSATISSIMAGLRDKQVHQAIDTSSTWDREVEDPRELGFRRIMNLKQAKLDSFRYGAEGSKAVLEEEEEEEEEGGNDMNFGALRNREEEGNRGSREFGEEDESSDEDN